MHKPDIIPRHTDSNGWWHILPEAKPPKVLDRTVRVRTAIVGGGICGVSVAHRLGELCPDDKICLLEAERIGYGASGRSAGFMLDLHSHGMPKHPDILRRNMKLWKAGLNSLKRKVKSNRIQCDWSDSGRFYGAAGRDGEQRLRQFSRTLDLVDVPYRPEDQRSLKRRLGTAFYTGGIFTAGNALVNPSAMMRGLAENLPSNVATYEETPVINLGRAGNTIQLQTPKARVVADRIVLATGVFLRLFGVAVNRIVPMATYASLTAPLDRSLSNAFGEVSEFGLLASSEYGSTIRLTRDRRLLVRNHFNLEAGAPPPKSRVREIARKHRLAMAARWPELAHVPFEHSWGGIMAFTGNDGTIFGRRVPGVYLLLTNDVSPTTRGEASGTLLAELMEGLDSELLSIQMSIPTAGLLPPRPFLDLGIGLRRAHLRLVAGKEL